jgi:histidyl-tRNA synthetase
LQARIQKAFEEVADLFNFRMMEPAPLEHLSILRAKSGADVDKEIYAFKDKGGRDVGLRFDLTVGMTRYVCARRDLRPPVKLASVAGAWRYDEPQHARYRWFRQWDLEIFGPPSLEADAEVVEASYRLFENLGLGNFSVQVGDRETVQHFVEEVLGIKEKEKASEMMRALDKVQKRSLSDLKAEYAEKGFRPEDIDRLFEFGSIRGPPGKVLSRLSESKVESTTLESFADIMKGRGVDVELNLGVVRGIDYYTGVVFEVVDNAHPDLGSLAGGGRYDLLPGAFGRSDLSATGAAGGMERIALSLSKGASRSSKLAYVAVAGKAALGESRRVLRELRANGVPAESALSERALAKQLEDASRLGASWVIILGEKEIQVGKVTLRDMANRTEEMISFPRVLDRLKHS